MKLKNLDPILKSYLIRAIRDSFKRSKLYKEARLKSRVEKVKYKKDGTPAKRPAVFYKCQKCFSLEKDKNVEVDHRDPVTSLYTSINELTIESYIARVYCNINNLQVLCKPCHKEKTKQENKLRKTIKKK